MTTSSQVLKIEELSNGYCMTMGNAYRLIEDGEKLLDHRRYLGAMGCFVFAMDEMVKGHLISEAALIDESDEESWERFWAAFNDRVKRQHVLETEILPNMGPLNGWLEKFEHVFPLLQNGLHQIWLNEDLGQFTVPGEFYLGNGDDETMAKDFYECALTLFNVFNQNGLPDPQVQFQVFNTLRQTSFSFPPVT